MSANVPVMSGVYDGVPVSGLMELNGVFLLFDLEFLEEADDYGELYDVWPASEQLVRLMKSSYARYLRYVAAGAPPHNGVAALESERDAAIADHAAIASIRAELGPPQKMRLSFTRPSERLPGYQGWHVDVEPAVDR